MLYIAPSEHATHTMFELVGDRQYVIIRALGRVEGSILSFIVRVKREFEVEYTWIAARLARIRNLDLLATFL
jgi:hypothetical protein